jgi:hypothetical protein
MDVLITDIWHSKIMSAKAQTGQQVLLKTMFLEKVLKQISIAFHKQGKFIFQLLHHSNCLLTLLIN